MESFLLAELAILHEFKTFGVVSLVLISIVVSLLAFGAGEGDLDSCVSCHFVFLRFIWPFTGHSY